MEGSNHENVYTKNFNDYGTYIKYIEYLHYIIFGVYERRPLGIKEWPAEKA